MNADSAWIDARLEHIEDRQVRCLFAVVRGLPPAHWPEPTDPPELLALAERNRIAGELRRRFAGAGTLAPPWAKAMRPALEAQWMAEAHANVVRGEVVRTLGERFAQEGVRLVAFKGLHLALAIYAEPGDRPFGDVDLLVRAHDREKALRILLDEGFDRGIAQTGFGAIEASFLKDVAPGIPLEIDLHWKLVGPLSLVHAMSVDAEAIIDRSRPAFPGIDFPTVEDAIVLAAVNLVRHGFRPLRNILDLRELARHADPATLDGRATEAHTRAAVALGLALAVELFNATPPNGTVHQLPRWQQLCFRRLLRPSRLAQPEPPDMALARYALRVLAQDGSGGVLRTVVGLPRIISRRLGLIRLG